MIYNVLLAEDEPAAMRHLKSTIEKVSPNFNIIATAEDGNEAFEKIKQYPVDVLITDIRMPHTDGLELSGKVKEQYPEILTVILSGYQEFDYAQKAIRHDVVQYLLKPININDFKTMMQNITEKLDKAYYWKTYKYIQSYFSSEIETNLQETRPVTVHASVLRINGLHPKYHEKMSHNPCSCVKASLERILLLEEKGRIFLYSGRDKNEHYLFCEKENIHYSRFREIIKQFAESLSECQYYMAVIALDVSVPNLPSTLGQLFKILREKTVLGVSSIYYEKNDAGTRGMAAEINSVLRSKMEHLFLNNDLDKLKTFFSEWLSNSRKNKIPLKQIELEFFQFISHVSANIPDKNNLLLKTEIMMDDIFQDVESYADLLNGFINIMTVLQKSIECTPSCIGSEESFCKIKDYIRQHLADDLSVGFICSQFHISHSYLNKLFHKYEARSILEFIKEQRVSASIEIMKNSPDLPLKDISRIVGYEDSSYFSRVFKSQTGLSPRQYQDKMN